MSDTPNTKLATCHACNASISKSAKTCPHCGQKNPYKKSSKFLKYAGYLFLFYMVCTFISMASQLDVKNMATNTSTVSNETAKQQCVSAIKASVNNPSTLNIDWFSGYGSKILADGTILITQTFSAKNGFGLEKSYDAYCTISPDGKLKDFNTAEQDG